MTLEDLQRPIRTLAEKVFYGVHQKNLNEDRPVLYIGGENLS